MGNAFPIREGDILNIRNIEQGIEQMKRLGSQNVSVELEPGSKPLATNIVLETTKKPPIHGMVSIDDSGLKETGNYSGLQQLVLIESLMLTML